MSTSVILMINYIIETNEKEQFIIRLVEEPYYIHSLDMAPVRREPALSQGNWLILAG